MQIAFPAEGSNSDVAAVLKEERKRKRPTEDVADSIINQSALSMTSGESSESTQRAIDDPPSTCSSTDGNGDQDDEEEDDYDDEEIPTTSVNRSIIAASEVVGRFNDSALDRLFSQLGGRMHAPVVAADSSGNDSNSSSYHHPSLLDDDGLHAHVKGEEEVQGHEDKGLPVTITSSVTEISPRRLRSRARASTFSSTSKSSRMGVTDNPGGSLVMDMIRSPMGHLTWLASLEDDDFVAAKMLTELGSGTAPEQHELSGGPSYHVDNALNNPPIIPRRRRAQSAIEISSSSSLKHLAASASSSARRRSKGTSSDKLNSSFHGVAGGTSRGSTGGSSKSAGGASRSSGGASRGSSGGASRGSAGGASRGGGIGPVSSLGGGVLGFDHMFAGLRGGNGGGISSLFSVQLSSRDRGSVLNPTTFKGDPYWAMEGRDRGYLGLYSPTERRRRIDRFLNKRRSRIWSKSVKYDVRKNFADSRIRVKGRFVKKEEQEYMLESLGITSGNGGSSGSGSNHDSGDSSGGGGGGGGGGDDDHDRDGTEVMYDDEGNDHEGMGMEEDEDDEMEEDEEEEE